MHSKQKALYKNKNTLIKREYIGIYTYIYVYAYLHMHVYMIIYFGFVLFFFLCHTHIYIYIVQNMIIILCMYVLYGLLYMK